MQTALASVGCNDKFYKTRTLFDTGSNRTYVTELQTFSVYFFGNTKVKQKTSRDW